MARAWHGKVSGQHKLVCLAVALEKRSAHPATKPGILLGAADRLGMLALHRAVHDIAAHQRSAAAPRKLYGDMARRVPNRRLEPYFIVQ